MNIKKQRIAALLTYAGTLPLVIASLGPIAHIISPGDALHIALTYSAIIVSFLAGIHWACYLFYSEKCPRNLLLTSNAVALLSWLSLLVHQPLWSVLLLMLCFLYLLVLDFKLMRAAILPSWFYSLRRNATVIVVLALSITMRHV